MSFDSFMFQELVRSVIALFVVVDPLGLVPIFMSLTQEMEKVQQRRTFRVGIYTGTGLLLIFALAGHELLLLFGISLYSFMIAGGILLFILSIKIIVGASWNQAAYTAEDVGVFPIGFPLLVGPGAITTTIVILQSAGFIVALMAVIIVMFLTWLTLRYLDTVYRLLGRRGSAAIAKVMAVFIAAIAVQFILTGLQFYYPSSRS